jgi:hypothetical protein
MFDITINKFIRHLIYSQCSGASYGTSLAMQNGSLSRLFLSTRFS